MADKSNKAPFDWESLVTKFVGVLVIGLAVWVWNTNSRVGKLEDYEATKSKFWRLHSQERDAINTLIVEFNARHPDDPPLELFTWQLPESDE